MRIVLLLVVVCAAVAPAQPYIISTFGGGAPPLPAPVPALTVPVFPGSMVTDTAGNVYFLARGSYVLKLDQRGVLSRVAGNGRTGYSGDGGPASSAQLLRAQGIAVDGAGNLFIADSGNNRIRRVSPNGIITTVVGDGTTGTFPIDGVPATSAPIRAPSSVAVDSAGNLFIAEGVYGLIRKVSPDGIITTVSGCRISCSPGSGFGGPATSSSQGGGGIVVADGFGNLFVARAYSINKVSPDGVITAFAGGTNPFDCATCLGDNGPATKAAFAPYGGLAVDNAGNLFVGDSAYRRIRKISPDGIITTVAGSAGLNGAINAPQFAGDGGPATAALLGYPGGVAVDGTGNLFIADAGNGRIRKVTSDGIINTVAGKDDSQACFFGDGGSALNAGLCGPYDVAVDKSGNVFIADLGSYRVRKVSPDGVINTVAGNGVACFGCPLTGDGGLATNASIVAERLAVDSGGNLFIAGSFSVRKVSPDGIITTVAGNGTQVHSGDGGPAKQAGIRGAVGVAVGPKGQLFISEGLYDVGTQIREVLPDGTITTVAGTGTAGYPGNYSGDGGPAVSAQLAPPSEDCFYDDGDGLAVDTAGDLFIADSGNNRIRQVTPGGTIDTVAGNGSCNYNPTCPTMGDGGPATQAGLAYPVSEALDTAGNMYIVEGSRVRKVTPDGIITTIAGSDYFGYSGYSGDGGLATDAALSSGVWGAIGPEGVAVDSAGNVYVADTGNNAVRILRPAKSSVVITAVVNAASQKAGPVSPDEIVTIYGAGLGPPQLTTDPNAGTRVFFNGVPAQIIYTSAKQIGAIVPESIAAMAQVTVSYRGQVSDAISVPVGPYSLGLFTLNQTGVGQAAATNADGTVNTAANPAKIGSSISLYANSRDDPNVPVSVTIGGILSTVQYWDSTGNVERVKVQIPNSVQPGGYVPVVLKVGDASTTDSAVWIAVSGN